MPRERLTGRRECHTFAVRYANIDYTVGMGVFDDGRPAEVFVTGPKAGSDVQCLGRDGAILLSLALQFGAPLATIQHALSRAGDATAPASLIGVLVDTVAAEADLLAKERAGGAVEAEAEAT